MLSSPLYNASRSTRCRLHYSRQVAPRCTARSIYRRPKIRAGGANAAAAAAQTYVTESAHRLRQLAHTARSRNDSSFNADMRSEVTTTFGVLHHDQRSYSRTSISDVISGRHDFVAAAVKNLVFADHRIVYRRLRARSRLDMGTRWLTSQ